MTIEVAIRIVTTIITRIRIPHFGSKVQSKGDSRNIG